LNKYKQKKVEPKMFSISASLAITKIQGEILLQNLRSMPNSKASCGLQHESRLAASNFDNVLVPALTIFKQTNVQEVLGVFSLEISRIICEFAGTELPVQSTAATQGMKQSFRQQITNYFDDQKKQFAKRKAKQALNFHTNPGYIFYQLREAEKKKGTHFRFDTTNTLEARHIHNRCEHPELAEIYYKELARALKMKYRDFSLRSVRVTGHTIFVEF
jgi:hypothetical protein